MASSDWWLLSPAEAVRKLKTELEKARAALAANSAGFQWVPKEATDARAQQRQINFPGVNGCAICDCGGTTFRVGIECDAVGNNHIRCLECAVCKHILAVPFFHAAAP